MKYITEYSALILLLFTAIQVDVYAQTTFKVKGTISTSGTPVRYAVVTFISYSDFSVQYSRLTDSTGAFDLGSITSVKQGPELPKSFELDQNYPNPFASKTEISYKLEKQSNVKVTIYDVIGREIRNFNVGFQTVGVYGVMWDGRNDFGRMVAPGVYFYRLQAKGEAQVKKMVFGMGMNVNSVLLPQIAPLRKEKGTGEVQNGPGQVVSSAETFGVQISNTDSTSPIVVPQQFTGVVVKSDTTLSFSVNTPQAIVYLDSTRQLIEGFGGNNVLIFGRPDMTPAEVQTAFGNGNGQVGMTIMRVSIPPDSTQFGTDVPSAYAADALGAKVIATPWTPPAWMKSNNSLVGGSLNPSAYAAFASHLKAFADTMASHGAPVYAVSVQNEPDFNASYQSCLWNATQFLNFMKNNAPSVGVPVFMPESENFKHQLSDSTLNDSAACANVAFVGGHIYGVAPSSYPLALSKGKGLWMTEHYTTSTDSGNVWSTALPVAKEINDCMNANFSAYVWWYIVRFYGPIDENGNVTKRGYIMSQYARFVRPGFYRVLATATPMPNVYVTAYKDGAKVVIVAINMSSTSLAMPFTLQGGAASTFTPYVTSSTENCLQGNNISVSNGSFAATLEGSSVTTFVSN